MSTGEGGRRSSVLPSFQQEAPPQALRTRIVDPEVNAALAALGHGKKRNGGAPVWPCVLLISTVYYLLTGAACYANFCAVGMGAAAVFLLALASYIFRHRVLLLLMALALLASVVLGGIASFKPHQHFAADDALTTVPPEATTAVPPQLYRDEAAEMSELELGTHSNHHHSNHHQNHHQANRSNCNGNGCTKKQYTRHNGRNLQESVEIPQQSDEDPQDDDNGDNDDNQPDKQKMLPIKPDNQRPPPPPDNQRPPPPPPDNNQRPPPPPDDNHPQPDSDDSSDLSSSDEEAEPVPSKPDEPSDDASDEEEDEENEEEDELPVDGTESDSNHPGAGKTHSGLGLFCHSQGTIGRPWMRQMVPLSVFIVSLVFLFTTVLLLFAVTQNPPLMKWKRDLTDADIGWLISQRVNRGPPRF